MIFIYFFFFVNIFSHIITDVATNINFKIDHDKKVYGFLTDSCMIYCFLFLFFLTLLFLVHIMLTKINKYKKKIWIFILVKESKLSFCGINKLKCFIS